MLSVKAPENAQAFMDTTKQLLLHEVFIFSFFKKAKKKRTYTQPKYMSNFVYFLLPL